MTDEERKNRNPRVEYATFNPAECPEVRVAGLELHHVYILEGKRNVASFNYMGEVHVLDPFTLAVVLARHFYGPRANLHVYLLAGADGRLQDGEGHIITVRRYTGEDA